jgi:hypothetical protein
MDDLISALGLNEHTTLRDDIALLLLRRGQDHD